MAKGGAASEAKAPTLSELPDLGPIPSKQLRTLAKKLIKLKDEYRIADHIRDNVVHKFAALVIWHLIAHDANARGETRGALGRRWGKRPVLFCPAKGELESLKVETLSYSGDVVPPGIARPSGVEEDMKHILSLDLSPFPALVNEFGHETMSLFVEAPNSGEFNDGAALLGSPKLSEVPKGGQPMALGAIELPAKLRKSGKSSDAIKLRSVLGAVEALAFGPAYWIQQNLGASVTLQLNDAFINLGDCGSLYIGDFGTTWQCF